MRLLDALTSFRKGMIIMFMQIWLFIVVIGNSQIINHFTDKGL